jgi:hypothetical protein
MLTHLKPAKTPIGNWQDGIAGLFLVLALLIIAIPVTKSEYDFTQSAERAKGIVTHQNHGKHHVEVQFTTAKGEVIHYAQNGWISYETGDAVTVLYNPQAPSELPSTDDIGALYVWTISLLFWIGAFLLLSLGCIFLPDYFSGPFSRLNRARS